MIPSKNQSKVNSKIIQTYKCLIFKWRFKHEIQTEICKYDVLNTVKEVKVDKEFIVAVFWNDEED